MLVAVKQKPLGKRIWSVSQEADRRKCCPPENSPYNAENAIIDAEFREGSHSPRIRALQIVAAGTNTVNLSVRQYWIAQGNKRLETTYVPYLSAMIPGRIREGTFIAFRSARR